MEHDRLVLALGDAAPQIDPEAFVAPGVTLVGAVRLGAQASVWYGSVLRGDGDSIEIGAFSNIQDGCVGHADPGFPLRVGERVSVGHRAVLHGCTIEDEVLVGMGAVVLNGARIGTGSLLAAGTIVLEGTEIPPRSLVAGVPGKIRRKLDDAAVERIRANAAVYVAHSARHRDARPLS